MAKRQQIQSYLFGGSFVAFPEILEKVNREYASSFKNSYSFDEKTVRLKELEYEGILKSERRGRTVFYALRTMF